MPKIVEYSYGKLFKYTMKAINPIKKAVKTTECFVHKAINTQALIILKNDKKLAQYELFSEYIADLNLGVVWADQDFRSSGHFYNPVKDRGLYGNTNALTLAKNYYAFAISFLNSCDIKKAMFFLGAAAHLVQDMTVPQHANIKLLKEHHKFEKFVRDKFYETPDYFVADKGCYLLSIEDFITHNSVCAIKANKILSRIEDEEERFSALSRYTVPLAQRTTAGLFMMFYNDAQINKSKMYSQNSN
ncbi:phospholipase C [Ruminiclostridium sufflavum DSM 19573]|uniref:Phospholipase C n=1 Tax=Ruminiclostridium sufflavum DSM 19573 TaxID=1121337 RepID=A0A318Y8H4_9FIRM|nr:zinc dependent phospholipase C family protein [Ruminiclostridium sufflavum]PYG88524.1 phospholipase C [Ruminiclostridium sufflavum DSM 19573]